MRATLLFLLMVSACDRTAELLPSSSDGGVGTACTSDCAQGLTCFLQYPDGSCSKTCSGPGDCPSGTVCGAVDDTTMICLPACNPSAGANCRDGYSCCPDHLPPTTGPGACAPTGSTYCGG